MKRLLLPIIFWMPIVLWTIFFAPDVFASNEFDISIDSSYNFNPGMPTQVNHTISIKNLTSKSTLSEYSLQLSTAEITQIKAHSQSETLIPQLNHDDNQTTIHLKLNHPALGQDKTNLISISYLDDSLAQSISENFQVNIPPLNRLNQFQKHQVYLFFPSYLSQPSIIIPATQPKLSISSTEFSYQSPEETIKLIFGHTQSYQLDYHITLENPDTQPKQFSVTLPPLTTKQISAILNIDPKPKNIITDSLGNWLALYTLRPSSVQEINLSVLVNKSVTNYPYSTQTTSETEFIGLSYPDTTLHSLDQLNLTSIILGLKTESENSIYLPQITISDQYISELPTAQVTTNHRQVIIKNPELKPAIVPPVEAKVELPAFVPPLSTQNFPLASPPLSPLLLLIPLVVIIILLVYNRLKHR